VSPQGLRRVGGACAVLLACTALALTTGVVPSTLALFNGETTNAGSALAGGWVVAPSGLTASVSGNDVSLGWTAGNHGVAGQRLLGVDNGTTNNCTGVTYAGVANMAAATTTSYTHANVGSGSANGHYYCYQLVSTSTALSSLSSPTGWTAAATVGPMRVGLVATSVALANHGTGNRVDRNDTITITFNQPTNVSGTSIKVCAVTGSNTIYLGDGASSCGSGDTYSIGKLTGKTISATRTFTGTTLAGAGTSTLTITLPTGSGSNANLSGTGAWTFTPAATVKSSATTDQATICSTGSACLPTTSSTF
jgi:hypothetical protein